MPINRSSSLRMNARSLWLSMALAALGIALMTAFAATGNKIGLTLVAVGLGLVAAAAAVRINAPLWRRPQSLVTPAAALARTTRLTALIYGACGAAMFAIYLLTPLRWQHGWQYALALTLAAVGAAVYARRLEASGVSVDFAAQLAGLQAIAVAVALIWMIASGKLDTVKDDWAANAIFLAGGFAIVVVSVVAVKTHAALKAFRASANS